MILKFLFIGLLASFYLVENTNAFYIANQTSLNNSIQAGTWGITISNIQSVIATPHNSNVPKAVISWKTNDAATSNLEWRTDSAESWIQVGPEDTIADATSHSREIEGLLTDSHYYYKVKSKDVFGNESISAEQSFDTMGMSTSDTSFNDVVINEFLPNPVGDDAAPIPDGEWVELYNRSDSVTYDLTGWYLTDSDSSHRLDIPQGTIIAPYGFVVVYRNADSDFQLNEDADQVRLYDGEGNIVDQHSYDSGLGDIVLENKSFARFPDGTDTWFDPIPTPGRPNILQSVPPTPSIELNLINDKKAISINLFNLSGFLELSYELTYTAYDVKKGVIGSGVDISGKSKYHKEIDLATCSSDVCTYDEKVHDFTLKVTLTNQVGKETIIEKFL